MDGLDPQATANTLISTVLGVGTVAFCIRAVIKQADKRASVAEEREKVCTTTLASTLTTVAALTTEVRKSGEDGSRELRDLTRRMDDGVRHLDRLDRGVREGMREILDAIRNGKSGP